MNHKKFSEHVSDYKALIERNEIYSRRQGDTNKNWIATGKACVKLNRKFIGIEMEAPTFNNTLSDLK